MPVAVTSQSVSEGAPPSTSSQEKGAIPTLSESLGHDISETRRELRIAAFTVANLVIFQLALDLPIFQEVAPELRLMFGAVFIAFAPIFFWLTCRGLIVDSLPALGNRVLSSEIILTLAMAGVMIGAVFGAVSDSSAFFSNFGYISYYYIGFLVVLRRFIEARFIRDLTPKVQFSKLDIGKGENEGEGEAAFKFGPGETILCDGVVTEGLSLVEERRFSGATRVLSKQPGQQVYGASRVLVGRIGVQQSCLRSESTVTTFLPRMRQIGGEFLGENRGRKKLVTLFNCLLLFFASSAVLYWSNNGAAVSEAAGIGAAILLSGVFLSYIRLIPYAQLLSTATGFMQGLLIRDGSILDSFEGVKGVGLELGMVKELAETSISDFKILDDRIDEEQLLSLLLSICSSSDEDFYQGATKYILSELGTPETVFEIRELNQYQGLGVTAHIQGVELSLGTEEFMIKRGVQVQPTELGTLSSSLQRFVAIGSDIVGKFEIDPPLEHDGRLLKNSLDNEDIRTVVMAERNSDPEELEYVRQTLELGTESIDKGSPVAFNSQEGGKFVVTSNPKGYQGVGRNTRTIAPFDELYWNIDEADVTMLEPNLNVLRRFFEMISRYKRVNSLNVLLGTFTTALLVVLAITRVASPVMVAFAALLVTFVMQVSVWSLYREN